MRSPVISSVKKDILNPGGSRVGISVGIGVGAMIVKIEGRPVESRLPSLSDEFKLTTYVPGASNDVPNCQLPSRSTVVAPMLSPSTRISR